MRRIVVAMAVLLAACGGGSESGGAGGGAPPDAAAVLAGLRARVPTISETTVYTADSDPNKLLGRPGQYSSKAGFHDQRVAAKDVEFESQPFAVRRGGDIEVFADKATAQKRADYIGEILNAPGSAVLGGPEYMYVRGGVLLRVSGALSPAVAGEYERALAEVVT